MAKEIDHEVSEWGRKEGLTEKTIQTLLDHDLMSLERIRRLTLEDVDNKFLTPKLISISQCKTLRKAIPKLKGEPSSQSVKELSSTRNVGHGVTQTTSKLPSDHSKSTRAGTDFKSQGERETLRILLTGNTGTGKSCTGNTILGHEEFESGLSFDSVSSECIIGRSERPDGTKIEVIDSPGLFDTKLPPEEIGAFIVKTIAMMYPGLDAILYVTNISSRYTKEQYAGYKRIKAILDENVTKYTIIAFTHGDVLKRQNKTIEELLDESTSKLKKVLKACSKRIVVFDNMTSEKEPQVQDLLKKIRDLKVQNCGKVYECSKFDNVTTIMREEITRRLAAVEQSELERKNYVIKLKEKVKMAEEEIKKQTEMYEQRLKINDEKREKEMEALKTKLEREKAEIERQRKEEEKRHQEKEKEFQEERERFQKAEEERRQKEFQDLKCLFEREKTDKEKEKQLINDLHQRHEKQRENERRRWKEEENARIAEYKEEAKARAERAEKQFKEQIQELEKKQKAEKENEKATLRNEIKKLEDDNAAKLKELNDTIQNLKEEEAKKGERNENELKLLKDIISKLTITNEDDLQILKYLQEENINFDELKKRLEKRCLIL